MKSLQDLLTGDLEYSSNWKIVQRVKKPEFDLRKSARFESEQFIQNLGKNDRVVCSNDVWIDTVSEYWDKPFNDCTESEKLECVNDFLESVNENLRETIENEVKSLDKVYVDASTIEHDEYGMAWCYVDNELTELFHEDEDTNREAMYLAGYTPTSLVSRDLSNDATHYVWSNEWVWIK